MCELVVSFVSVCVQILLYISVLYLYCLGCEMCLL